MSTPPVAPLHPHPHRLHGNTRPDDYYWLRERENPEVIAHLEAENAYLEAETAPLKGLRERLYAEMLSHLQQTDLEVPVQDGAYFYYTRTQEGKGYRIHCRKRARSRAELGAAPEEVLLDLNTLAEGKEYLSVTTVEPSPDGRLLAYLQNETGSDLYTLRVKNLETGEPLPDHAEGVALWGSVAWDATGEHLFYVTADATQRPWRLYRHRLGEGGPDPLLYEETDETFRLQVYPSSSRRFLFARSSSTLTDEVRYLQTNAPEGEFRVFAPRVRGVKYELEHWGEDFLIRTNENALNFKLLCAPLARPERENWQELVPHQEAVYLTHMRPFQNHLLIEGRQEGLTQLWVRERASGRTRRLTWPEPIYTVGVGENREYRASAALLTYQSMVTPRQVLELELDTLFMTVLKQDEVPGGFDPTHYVQERLWATAEDGVRVPISLVRRKEALEGGPAPLLLYGYGSYGITLEPGFNPNRLPLLDRGVVFALAHVRGGAELGRGWYEDGKLLHKRNTFTDFVACAEALIAAGYTAPEKLAAMGGSAGGLLMGVVLNLRPDLFRAVVAQVPFVDVITTMLDTSIPLTTGEWDEWGNPTDPEYYAYMRSYSPYDNVEARAYPHLLVTTGLNDPRVAYWEPAKWVARLRATKYLHGSITKCQQRDM
ncbi:MAG: oligopeptidase B [Meiothermus sp.]